MAFSARLKMRAFRLILPLACSLAVGLRPAAAVDTNKNNFGFTGPETYPIDPFIADLHAADLDGDGLTDLIVVNNSRSKIMLLYNQTGKTNRAPATPKNVRREINELPPDARFRIESIASEKRIAALVVADKAEQLSEGVELAAAALKSGAARRTLARLVEVSND